MAKLGRWPTFSAMAKDLQKGLRRLTYPDNFQNNEFIFRDSWFPKVRWLSTVTMASMVVNNAIFWKLGDEVRGFVDITFEVAPTAGIDSQIFISLPFPYQVDCEDTFEVSVSATPATGWALSGAHSAELIQNQWLKVWLEDGVGHPMNFYHNNTTNLRVEFCYKAFRGNWLDISPIEPPNPVIFAANKNQFTAYTPTIDAPGANMSIASTQSAHGRWLRIGDMCHVYMDFSVTTADTADTTISATLPFTASPNCLTQVGPCYPISSGTYHTDGLITIAASGTVANFIFHDRSNWGIGAGERAYSNFWYETAHA